MPQKAKGGAVQNTLYFVDNLPILREHMREKPIMDVLTPLNEPTGPMAAEAIGASVHTSPIGHKYHRIQILTIEQLLVKVTPKHPYGTEATFKPATGEQPGGQKPLF